jgi:ribonuclease HII
MSSLVGYIDEVGRNSIAGALYSCCLVGNLPDVQVGGVMIDDSKKLSEEEREIIWQGLRDRVVYGIGKVTVEEINKLKNVHTATLLSFARAVAACPEKPTSIFIDGKYKIPEKFLQEYNLNLAQHTVVRGDSRIINISAASILAKVELDHVMKSLHDEYPAYGFKSNKGYFCPRHGVALKKYGVSKYHRIWMNQVQRVLSGDYDEIIARKYQHYWRTV